MDPKLAPGIHHCIQRLRLLPPNQCLENRVRYCGLFICVCYLPRTKGGRLAPAGRPKATSTILELRDGFTAKPLLTKDYGVSGRVWCLEPADDEHLVRRRLDKAITKCDEVVRINTRCRYAVNAEALSLYRRRSDCNAAFDPVRDGADLEPDNADGANNTGAVPVSFSSDLRPLFFTSALLHYTSNITSPSRILSRTTRFATTMFRNFAKLAKSTTFERPWILHLRLLPPSQSLKNRSRCCRTPVLLALTSLDGTDHDRRMLRTLSLWAPTDSRDPPNLDPPPSHSLLRCLYR